MKLERRWELPGRAVALYDRPGHCSDCAWSIFWYCSRCSYRYAELRSWINNRPAPWTAIAGCCPTCPSDRFLLAGTLETYRFVGKDLPKEVLLYEITCELKFLDHPDHPRNKELI